MSTEETMIAASILTGVGLVGMFKYIKFEWDYRKRQQDKTTLMSEDERLELREKVEGIKERVESK